MDTLPHYCGLTICDDVAGCPHPSTRGGARMGWLAMQPVCIGWVAGNPGRRGDLTLGDWWCGEFNGSSLAQWEVQRESDWRNNKHKTHTQAERGSMTERRDPHKISVEDTNKSWLWLWVCNLFDFQRCKGFVCHLAVRLLWWGVIHNQF